MLSDETATSAASSGPHAKRAPGACSPLSPAASPSHIKYGSGDRSQITSMSVCMTEYPMLTTRATSPVRMPAKRFHEPELCWLDPSREKPSVASGVRYAGASGRAESRVNAARSTAPMTKGAADLVAKATKLMRWSFSAELAKESITKPGP
eukprot:scaffold4853_cov105-Isochrysis_galbana.AAC.8